MIPMLAETLRILAVVYSFMLLQYIVCETLELLVEDIAFPVT